MKPAVLYPVLVGVLIFSRSDWFRCAAHRGELPMACWPGRRALQHGRLLVGTKTHRPTQSIAESFAAWAFVMQTFDICIREWLGGGQRSSRSR